MRWLFRNEPPISEGSDARLGPLEPLEPLACEARLATWQASNTPLHWAAGRGRADVVAMLLAAGADRNATKQVSQLRRHKAHNLVTEAGGS